MRAAHGRRAPHWEGRSGRTSREARRVFGSLALTGRGQAPPGCADGRKAVANATNGRHPAALQASARQARPLAAHEIGSREARLIMTSAKAAVHTNGCASPPTTPTAARSPARYIGGGGRGQPDEALKPHRRPNPPVGTRPSGDNCGARRSRPVDRTRRWKRTRVGSDEAIRDGLRAGQRADSWRRHPRIRHPAGGMHVGGEPPSLHATRRAGASARSAHRARWVNRPRGYESNAAGSRGNRTHNGAPGIIPPAHTTSSFSRAPAAGHLYFLLLPPRSALYRERVDQRREGVPGEVGVAARAAAGIRGAVRHPSRSERRRDRHGTQPGCCDRSRVGPIPASRQRDGGEAITLPHALRGDGKHSVAGQDRTMRDTAETPGQVKEPPWRSCVKVIE